MWPQSREDITPPPHHPHPQLDVIGKETKGKVFLGGSGFQKLVDCLIVDEENDYREAWNDGANKQWIKKQGVGMGGGREEKRAPAGGIYLTQHSFCGIFRDDVQENINNPLVKR